MKKNKTQNHWIAELINFDWPLQLAKFFLSKKLPPRTYLVRWYGLQERFPRYMDEQERLDYYNAAAGFIRRYVAVARDAARQLL